jgi:hypothetical protein
LGFRFAPRIRDLADRRLFVADGRAVYTALNPMIGGTLDFRGISFLVWQIHKPIAGDGGSNVGAGKMDNQCVEKIPLLVFCWMERRPPTVGRYPGAYLRSLGESGCQAIKLFALGRYPAPKKSGTAQRAGLTQPSFK